MADIYTIPQILNIAKLAQSLAQNDNAIKNALQGGSLDLSLGSKIYIERMSVQRMYALNPNNSTLRATANYLFSILGKYAIQAQNIINGQMTGIPIVTGPSNQSVTTGDTVNFIISVTSALPYTIMWLKNGVTIPGETGLTLSFISQLSDNGNTYSAIVTNSAGSSPSDTATLTVTSTLVAYLWYGPDGTDPYPDLVAGIDTLTYQVSVVITHNQPIVYPIPSPASNNQYIVMKVPIGESIKNSWVNTSLNQGTFTSDSVFHDPFTANSWRFYVSRNAISLDPSQSLTIS